MYEVKHEKINKMTQCQHPEKTILGIYPFICRYAHRGK